MRENSSDELSYASLAFTGKRNVRKCTEKAEYAELQINKHSGVAEVVYSTVR